MFRQIFFCCILSLICSCSINRGDSEVCFIGDSIFAIWDIETYFPDFIIHKHAANGARLENLDEWNLTDCKDIPTVLLIGTNDIGDKHLDSANFHKFYEMHSEELYRRVKRLDAKPLLYISILPRNLNHKEDSTKNAYIESLNLLIKASLDSIEFDSRYIDVFSDFLNQGYQINNYLFKDGLHPNSEGYEILRARIEPYL